MTRTIHINSMETVRIGADGSGTITAKATRAYLPDVVTHFDAAELPAIRQRYMRPSYHTQLIDQIEKALLVPAGWVKSRRHWYAGAWLFLRHSRQRRWVMVWAGSETIAVYWASETEETEPRPMPDREELPVKKVMLAAELVGAIMTPD